MKQINLISDSYTIPTKEMKECILYSHIGDDIFQTDPSVLKLETEVASLLDMPGGVFVPTRIMANQIAIMMHTNNQVGVEVICGIDDNISQNVFSYAQMITLKQNDKGEFDLEQLVKVVRKVEGLMFPQTRIISLQSVYKNGNVLSLDYIQKIKQIAHQYELKMHLDGANIFNWSITTKLNLQNIAVHFDSVQVSLNKGLCCTAGSVLVIYSDYQINVAKKLRKVLGGSMRQSGLLATQGIHSLKQIYPHLNQDHQIAKILSEKLKQFPQLKLQDYNENISTNAVLFQFINDEYNQDDNKIQNFIQSLESKNVLINQPVNINRVQYYKLVTHYYIKQQQVDEIIEAFKQYFNEIQ